MKRVNALAGQLKTRRRRKGKYDHAAQPTTLVMTVMMDDGRCVTIGDGRRSSKFPRLKREQPNLKWRFIAMAHGEPRGNPDEQHICHNDEVRSTISNQLRFKMPQKRENPQGVR